MTDRCELYGLVIESEVPLRGIPVVARTSKPDVRVHLAARPSDAITWGRASEREFYRSEADASAAPPLVADRPGVGDILRLTYAEGIRFHVREDGSEVWCDWDAPLTEADALTFLLGPVLGLVLRRRGVLAVHASAIVRGGVAWAFVGPGGAGKSTMAAAFAQAGLSVLTEDVLALTPGSDRWMAWPAYDHLRLWGDSPAIPVGGAQALPALSPTWDKRALALESAGLARASVAVPLAGWFLLQEREVLGRITPLSGAAALRSLVENSYVHYLLDGTARAEELIALGRAAQGLRAYRLAVGEGQGGLADTVRAVSLTMAAVGVTA